MLDPGTRVGDYEIEKELGQGGMARVYKARHHLLETHHAIKVLEPELRANADARQRFLDEARIQAKHLDHPGIIKVTNIVATPEHAALIMELVEGSSLEAEATKLVDRPDEIKRIMIGVLDAVGYAHEVGIVHRDLKPANVLLSGPKRLTKVTDFGIAKTTRGDGSVKKKSTHATARMGTLNYMSPEQVRSSKNVTPRSDIFSLGAMLYELATGTLPFEAENDFDLMEQIVNGRYEPPAKRNPKIDPKIAAAIEKALQIDPEKRFATCAEFAIALGGTGTPSVIRKPGAVTAVPPPVTSVEHVKGDTPSGTGIWFAIGALAIIGGTTLLVVKMRGNARPEVGPPLAEDLAQYGSSIEGTGPLIATFDTTRGTIHCELFSDKAPRAVANFVGLATGKKPWRDPKTKQVIKGKPFYDGLTFHRQIADFGIQGGDPLGNGEGGPGYTFGDEVRDDVKHVAGSLAMWSVSPNTAGSQFAMYARDVPELDGSETVFGKCTEIPIIQGLTQYGAGVVINHVTISRGAPTAAVAPVPDAVRPKNAKLEPDPAVVYAISSIGPSDGPSDAKVTMVMARDYACPYCARVHADVLPKLRTKYGDDLRVVYKDLVVHPKVATAAALAACAADLVGKFHEIDERLWLAMPRRELDSTDVVTANGTESCWNTPLGCEHAVGYARELGLDVDAFKSAMAGVCVGKMQSDQEQLARLGVGATPAFFINGRYLSGAQPVETFEKLIDEELRKANGRIAMGTPQASYYDTWVMEKGAVRVGD